MQVSTFNWQFKSTLVEQMLPHSCCEWFMGVFLRNLLVLWYEPVQLSQSAARAGGYLFRRDENRSVVIS